jgi:hypothetical protein
MVFIETSIFTRQVQALLTDAELRELQEALALRPGMGSLLVGGGGLRKVRWTRAGLGKSGGIRVIYYWEVTADQILMLFAFAKGERANLTSAQLKILKQIAEEDYP